VLASSPLDFNVIDILYEVSNFEVLVIVWATLSASSIGDTVVYTTKLTVWCDAWMTGLVLHVCLAFVVVVSPARISHHNRE
jgi:hypothetical protein